MAAKKATAIKTKYTKSAIIDSVAGSTDLSKKQVKRRIGRANKPH